VNVAYAQGSSIYSETAAANYENAGFKGAFERQIPDIPAKRLGTTEEVRCTVSFTFLPSKRFGMIYLSVHHLFVILRNNKVGLCDGGHLTSKNSCASGCSQRLLQEQVEELCQCGNQSTLGSNTSA